MSYYCQLKHGGFFGFVSCFDDPMCDFDFSQFLCMHRTSQLQFSLGKAYEVLHSSFATSYSQQLCLAGIKFFS